MTATNTNPIVSGSSDLLSGMPHDPGAHARAWYNATQVEHHDQLLDRGATPINVIIAWTLAGMPTEYYAGKKKQSGPVFAPGELRIFRDWAAENNLDSSSDSVKSRWFAEDKPQPEFSGDNATIAMITCRRINKDGSLSKAKTVDIRVRKGAFDAVRAGKRGRTIAQDYLQAAGSDLTDLAPVRIATRTDKGSGTTFQIDVRAGEDGTEFTTGDWVGETAAQRKAAEESALRATAESQAEELARLKALLAEQGVQV